MSLNRPKAENLPCAGKSNVKPHGVASNTDLNFERQVQFHAFGSGFGEENSRVKLTEWSAPNEICNRSMHATSQSNNHCELPVGAN